MTFDPWTMHVEVALRAPGLLFWLGSDELGRDVLARMVYGVGLSLGVAFGVWAIAGLIGVTLGLVAGWRGGWVAVGVRQAADVVLGLPGILVAMAVAALVGAGVLNVIFLLGCLGWVGFARLTLAQVDVVKNLPFVAAARLGGVSTFGILVRHVLPNIAGPLVVESVLVLAGAMVAEAGLSYLGVGVPPEIPSLGGMLREGSRYMLVAPHLVVVPGVMLICLVVSFNILAYALRNRLEGGKTAAHVGH